MSPTNTVNPILNLSETSSSASSEVNNSTIKNAITSPIPIPNNLSVNNHTPAVNSLSTTPIKSFETVTPINSRFIIKKIPQAELEKYTKPSDKSQAQTDQKTVNKQLAGELTTPAAKDESSESPTNTNEAAQPVKKENVERRINKFTVKKVDSSEIFLYDPNNQPKKLPQVTENPDNKSAKNDETLMKNGEINREQTFQEEQDKIKKNQANALTSQSSIEEQKQLANNVTENKANLNNNYSSSSRTNSMSEKSRVFF